MFDVPNVISVLLDNWIVFGCLLWRWPQSGMVFDIKMNLDDRRIRYNEPGGNKFVTNVDDTDTQTKYHIKKLTELDIMLNHTKLNPLTIFVQQNDYDTDTLCYDVEFLLTHHSNYKNISDWYTWKYN